MSYGWTQSDEIAERQVAQNTMFVRLPNDGDKVVVAFRGEPCAREVVWTGERYENYEPTKPDHDDRRPVMRTMINIFVPADDTMKVFEGGLGWFKDLRKVYEKYGFDKFLFEIERHGEARDMKTRYTILPDQPISDALRARLAACEPFDLERLANGERFDSQKKAPAASSPTPPPGGGLIDAQATAELVASLKTLPRADVDVFLGKMGVKRVRDLKASEVPTARAVLEGLRAKYTKEAEIDPFA